MEIWIGIVGALIGWLWADLDAYGFVIGGGIGLAFGWGFRRAMRAEIAKATGALQEQIDMLLAARAAPPAPSVAPPPVVERPAVRAPATVTRAPATIVGVERETPVRPAPEPQLEPEPTAPGIIETAFAAAKNWLFGGNTIVRVGLVVLFVGLSFLARYAVSAGLLPIEVRLSVVAAFGIALLVVGYRSSGARPGFGLALQGAGVATIYLTLFAAAKFYDTIPLLAAFALMVMVCALGCALALLQRSQALAVTSFAGGFAVPLLLSDGGGAVIGVFGFYTVLNLAILFIAQRRAWRGLNLLGFFATFGFLALWQASGYTPADYVATQGFLIVSVLIYVATALLYARATPGRLGGMVDTTLLFGPALAGFGLQVALVRDVAFGSAFAALGFAALYLGVAAVTMRGRRDDVRVMNETLLAIGIGFVTLAVPLALDARWTSAAWALEGAGAFWVGMRQARWVPRLFGLALILVAGLLYLAGIAPNVAPWPIANPGFVGGMIVALAALATAWWLRTPMPAAESRIGTHYVQFEALLARPAFLFGFGFWWIAFAVEVSRKLPVPEAGLLPLPVFAGGTQVLLAMLAFVASAWLSQVVARRKDWAVAAWPSHVSLVALVLGFVGALGNGLRVLETPAWAIWLVALGLHGRMLYLNDRDASAVTLPGLRVAHVGGVWLGAALLADALWLGIERGGLWPTAWAEVVLLASTVAVLAALTFWAGRALAVPGRRWPLDTHALDYGWIAAAPIALLVVIGTLLTALFSSGNAAPLPYVPLLNPVDLVLALALAVLEAWRRALIAGHAAPADLTERAMPVTIAALAFVVVNTVWLRLAHHLLGVAWDGDALLDSTVVQTGLAILWTSIALGLMVFAYARGRRKTWLVGAALLGATVVKLVLVDLNTSGGGARIVAFIGVGVLMLVVGYLAPLPPRKETAA